MLSASGIPTALDRVQQAQPATVYTQWERAGLPVDPGTVAVTVTSDRTGAPIVTSAPAAGTGTSRSYTLTPAQLANLDLLTLSWTASADSSVLTTFVEVVSRFLFPIAAARARSPLQDTSTYTTDSLLAYRTYAEIALEDICGVSFVPRYSRDVARLNHWGMLEVPRRRVSNLVQVTTMTNSGPQAVPTLVGARLLPGGQIYLPAYWNFFSYPISIAYEHGYPYPPPRVSRAALELARRWLIESPWDERMVAFRSREGGEVDILTAKGDPFDLPEVVAVSELYGLPLVA
jgi:hypothetical protein